MNTTASSTRQTDDAAAHRAIEEALAKGPTDDLGRTPFWEAQIRMGRTCVTLPAGRRFINVPPDQIRRNRSERANYPVVSVRGDGVDVFCPHACRETEIMGPAAIRHTPNDPLPCTGGHGVAYVETSAAVRCYLDPGVTELPLEWDAAPYSYAS